MASAAKAGGTKMMEVSALTSITASATVLKKALGRKRPDFFY